MKTGNLFDFNYVFNINQAQVYICVPMMEPIGSRSKYPNAKITDGMITGEVAANVDAAISCLSIFVLYASTLLLIPV